MKLQQLVSIFIISIFISSCGTKSIGGMKKNIDEKSNEISDLINFFKEIVPENYKVRIQYNASENVDLFVYESIQGFRARKIFGQWNVNIGDIKETSKTDYENQNQGKTTSLELVNAKLKWNSEIYNVLYEKLEDANCIGITNNEPIVIEYGFSGMALLSFMAFDHNLTIVEQEEYSDDCMSMFYKKNIALRYESGATGSMCTPEFKRNK